MLKTTAILVFALILALVVVGCGSEGDIVGVGQSGETEGGSGGGNGGGGATPAPSSFPMQVGANWVYAVTDFNDGTTETGTIEVTMVDYDSVTGVGQLVCKGKRIYHKFERVPETIYLRETDRGLECGNTEDGPWNLVYSVRRTSWSDGGFLFAGRSSAPSRLMQGHLNTAFGWMNTIHVSADTSNWNDPYAMDRFEIKCSEDFDAEIGLIHSHNYNSYQNRDPQYPLPIASDWEVALTGFAIPRDDGSVFQGGQGAEVQVMATAEPVGSFEVIEGLFSVEDPMTQLKVSFSMPMNQVSVEGNLSVTYYQGATLKDLPGTVTWYDAKTLIWTPDEPFPVAGVTLLRIETAAVTATGLPMNHPFEAGIIVE